MVQHEKLEHKYKRHVRKAFWTKMKLKLKSNIYAGDPILPAY